MDPERQRQVNEWMNELHNAAQRSYDTCLQLHARLTPVLRKEPTESTSTATPEIDLVDVAQAIREAVKVIDATAENHREMLRLLEV
jgi:hypothetical protein